MAVRHSDGGAPLVVVANRLPVERDDESPDAWRSSPGGLVAALEPVVRASEGTWVGWSGSADEALDPFEVGGLRMVPVDLSASEVEDYYAGFSNATLWPLYHDAIAPPQFERHWWKAYRSVNRRFAEAASAEAADAAVVWVQDYQLQLVPALLRELRPDLRIGFFDHIPFPGLEIFARLPWRRQIIEGLLGADLIGFQRRDDADNFLRAARRYTTSKVRGSIIAPSSGDTPDERQVHVGSFPISVDFASLERLADRRDVKERARQLRRDLGDPQTVLLGIDRLDYTKGILLRLRAYGELLDEGAFEGTETVLVQVASPSREHVEEYQRLRDDVELIVGRINGDHSTLGFPVIHYLHQTFPAEEMAALYLAADVMLVTPLRDGMNLVAKEFVASHHDGRGVLVLSEFTGAADELRDALLINPFDIDATKAAILAATRLPSQVAARRMASMRRQVHKHDVHYWAQTFLETLTR